MKCTISKRRSRTGHRTLQRRRIGVRAADLVPLEDYIADRDRPASPTRQEDSMNRRIASLAGLLLVVASPQAALLSALV